MSLQMIVIEMTQAFATAWGNQAKDLLEEYLGRVGDELGAQSGGIIKFTPSMSSMGFVSSWPDSAQGEMGTGTEPYEWLMNHLHTENGFYFSPDSWLPEAGSERALFGGWRCPHVICVPIFRGELKGFAFWGSENPVSWSINELRGLKQVGNIFGIGLDKIS